MWQFYLRFSRFDFNEHIILITVRLKPIAEWSFFHFVNIFLFGLDLHTTNRRCRRLGWVGGGHRGLVHPFPTLTEGNAREYMYMSKIFFITV